MRLPIAREGWAFILPLCGLTVVGMATVPWLGWPFLALTAFVCYFFRDPERTIPTTPGLLLSPADGKVIALTPQGDAAQEPVGTQVSIFLSVFDVHINRAPVSGSVRDVCYRPGKFLPAFRSQASALNEQNVVTFQTSDAQIVVKQVAGILARRIVCRVKAGDWLNAGERFGLIRFGSRVDIVIPPQFTVHVSLGERVRGGQSVLASHPSQASHAADVTEAHRSRTLA
jgi:phosphatidylserine decarboxylase